MVAKIKTYDDTIKSISKYRTISLTDRRTLLNGAAFLPFFNNMNSLINFQFLVVSS